MRMIRCASRRSVGRARALARGASLGATVKIGAALITPGLAASSSLNSPNVVMTFEQPTYVLANLPLRGGWPLEGLAWPAVMQIEHIQAFQDQSRVSPRLGEVGSGPGAMCN